MKLKIILALLLETNDGELLSLSFTGAVACVTLLDRLHQDTLSCNTSMLKSWQERPQKIVLRHIKKKLHITNGKS